MSETLPRNLLDQVTCPICLDQYQDPRVLPCLHTYCRHCLEDLFKKRSRFSIKCPECRDVVEVEDVSCLKVNFWVSRILLAMVEMTKANKRQGKTQVLCNNCDSNELAKARCIDCEKFVCDFCITAHQRMASLKHHELLILEKFKNQGVSDSQSTTICEKHKDEKLKLFCRTCKELICRDCTIIPHRGHNYDFIEDVIDEQKEKLTKDFKAANATKEKVESALKSLQELQEEVKKNKEFTENLIDRTINQKVQVFAQAFEEKRGKLKQDLKEKTALSIKELTDRENVLVTQLEILKNSTEFTETLLANGGAIDVLSLSNEVSMRLSQQSSRSHNLANYQIDYKDLRVPKLLIKENLLTVLVDEIDQFVTFNSDPDPLKCFVAQSFGNIEVHIKDNDFYFINIAKKQITIYNVSDDTENKFLEIFLFSDPYKHGVWKISEPKIHRPQPDCSTFETHTIMKVNFKVNGKIIKGNPIELCIWNYPNLRKSLMPEECKESSLEGCQTS